MLESSPALRRRTFANHIYLFKQGRDNKKTTKVFSLRTPFAIVYKFVVRKYRLLKIKRKLKQTCRDTFVVLYTRP